MKILASCATIAFVILIVSIGGIFLTTASCSEKTKASVRAIQTKAEDQLVAFAGEGEVALELMKNQYQALKERLVKIKTLKRTMERRANECEATAARLDEEGKTSMALRQRNLAERYRSNVERLTSNEIAAEEALKSFAAEYREFRDEINILKEEIAAVKAIGGLSDDLGVDNPFNTRMENVRELEQKLRTHLDRAEALVEVGDLEADL